MFKCRHIVIRPPVYFHSSRSFSSQPRWPGKTEDVLPVGDATKGLKNIVDESASTVITVNPNESARREAFNTWKSNNSKIYNPLDFLRSRSSKTQRRYSGAPFQVGPGAQEALQNDVFRQLDIDPLREVNNSTLLRAFVTSMGKIRPRAQTKLSWRSQRKVAKAIKRARQKGVLSILVNNGFIGT